MEMICWIFLNISNASNAWNGEIIHSPKKGRLIQTRTKCQKLALFVVFM